MRMQLIAVFAASLFSTAASAALPTFSELDSNRNGLLSEKEASALEQFQGEESDFVDADMDNDGNLSPAEYQAWVEIEIRSMETEKQ